MKGIVRLTPEDIVTQCLQVMKATRDTIEQALKHKTVLCKAAGPLESHRCRILAVHVDAYTGVALQLVSLEHTATSQLVNSNVTWVQATQCELPDNGRFEAFNGADDRRRT